MMIDAYAQILIHKSSKSSFPDQIRPNKNVNFMCSLPTGNLLFCLPAFFHARHIADAPYESPFEKLKAESRRRIVVTIFWSLSITDWCELGLRFQKVRSLKSAAYFDWGRRLGWQQTDRCIFFWVLSKSYEWNDTTSLPSRTIAFNKLCNRIESSGPNLVTRF